MTSFLQKIQASNRAWGKKDEEKLKTDIDHIIKHLKQTISDKDDDQVRLHGNRVVGLNECIKAIKEIMDDLKDAREYAKKEK
jgi:hypothetical protein